MKINPSENNLSREELLILVNEQKNLIKSLHNDEKQYHNLFENSLDGIYKSTPEGKFIDVNPALVKMIGYDSKKELLAIDIKKDLYFDIQDREFGNSEENKEKKSNVSDA